MSDKYVTKDDLIKYGTLFYLYKKLQPTKKQLIVYATIYIIFKSRKPIKATFNYTKDSVKTYKKSGTDGLSDKFVKDLTTVLESESDEEHARGVQRRKARRERLAKKTTVTNLTFVDGHGRVDTATETLPPQAVATPNKPKPRAKAKSKTTAS